MPDVDGDCDSPLAKLIEKRGRVRAIVSRYSNLVENTLDNNEDVKLKQLQTSLISKSAQLEQLDEAIQEIISEDDLTDEIQKSIEYNVKIREALQKIESYFQNENAVKKAQNTSISQASVKLPKLELPKFTGNKIEFQAFWDMFETAVLNNAALSKVQMFAYLMSSLQGEAKACLAGLTLTENNLASEKKKGLAKKMPS